MSKKEVEELEHVFSAGVAWLQNNGIINDISHNNIVLNLYAAFPKVRYLDYFLPEGDTNRKVWVRLYVPFWKLLLLNRNRLVDEVIDFLREYLQDYDIQVELKRYKKGVERSNEVPNTVLDHITSDSAGIASPSSTSTERLRATQPNPAPAEAVGGESGTRSSAEARPASSSGDSGQGHPA